MLLSKNGLDIFYVDESIRLPLFFATVVRVPFLKPAEGGGFEFVWPAYLEAADRWRRDLSANHKIRFREELHAHQILRRTGLLHKTHRNLTNEEAIALYGDALATADFLAPGSVFTVFAWADTEFAGHKGMGACLLGLFQRLRTQTDVEDINGLMFFDEGHDEYIKAFRQAQKYLPTGSKYGGWGGKATKNIRLESFPKDGNIKQSKFSYFLQLADLIGYAARIKIEQETGRLANKRVERGDHLLYDKLPASVVNLRATARRNDGIVPM